MHEAPPQELSAVPPDTDSATSRVLSNGIVEHCLQIGDKNAFLDTRVSWKTKGTQILNDVDFEIEEAWVMSSTSSKPRGCWANRLTESILGLHGHPSAQDINVAEKLVSAASAPCFLGFKITWLWVKLQGGPGVTENEQNILQGQAEFGGA